MGGGERQPACAGPVPADGGPGAGVPVQFQRPVCPRPSEPGRILHGADVRRKAPGPPRCGAMAQRLCMAAAGGKRIGIYAGFWR